MPGPFDLDELAAAATGAGGVVWSLADAAQLNVNLVVLPPDVSIAEHGNDDVDVLIVGLDGSVAVTVDGAVGAVGPRQVFVVPVGTRRSLQAGSDGARYLTVHVRRAPLQIRARR